MKAYNKVGVKEQKRRVKTVKKLSKDYDKTRKTLLRIEQALDRAVDACAIKRPKQRRTRHPEPEKLLYR